MAEYEVRCVRRDGSDRDRSLDGMGGPTFGYGTLDQILTWIRQGHQFYVMAPSPTGRAYLEIRPANAFTRAHVRTVPDGKYDNNLHSLQECPR